jgi:aspartate carbamoyltransferase catalytic subunit
LNKFVYNGFYVSLRAITMKNRSLVSIDDLNKEEVIRILDDAAEFEKKPVRKLLEGKVIATLFFEPSTRTRLSFESAINRLGGKIVGFSDAGVSSVSKGETLHDTIKMVSSYSDLIVMRHPIEGSARFASEISSVPVINAGDGANQHPTQTLLDLYSIRKTQGTLDNLNIFMVGDLKYGRTVHSLMMAMSRWNTTFNFISPEELKMPEEFKQYLDNLGLKYYEHLDFTDIISKADIIYMTRVQKERFSDPIEYEKVKNVYVLKNSMLANTKPNMRILHPLPRVNEIHIDVDKNPKAYYFEQALNGVYTRQAILCSLLGIK